MNSACPAWAHFDTRTGAPVSRPALGLQSSGKPGMIPALKERGEISAGDSLALPITRILRVPDCDRPVLVHQQRLVAFLAFAKTLRNRLCAL
jgi:hypothetical protein